MFSGPQIQLVLNDFPRSELWDLTLPCEFMLGVPYDVLHVRAVPCEFVLLFTVVSVRVFFFVMSLAAVPNLRAASVFGTVVLLKNFGSRMMTFGSLWDPGRRLSFAFKKRLR